jgi:hypothetical protein
MPHFAATSLATEEDLREMVETLGDYLDQWCERFLAKNLSATTKKWNFIFGYNVLELESGFVGSGFARAHFEHKAFGSAVARWTRLPAIPRRAVRNFLVLSTQAVSTRPLEDHRYQRKPRKGADMSRNRVILYFSDAAYERVQKIKKQEDASSNAELVRNALRFYAWYVEQKQQRNKIHTVSPDGKVVEVEFIF